MSGDGPYFPREELLRKVEADPFAVSAGALLRPMVQQFTLPCTLTIGGAAEVGYFAQLRPLASTLELAAPRIGLRLGATLIDGQAARISRRYPPLELARAGSTEELLLTQETPGELGALDDLARHAATTL